MHDDTPLDCSSRHFEETANIVAPCDRIQLGPASTMVDIHLLIVVDELIVCSQHKLSASHFFDWIVCPWRLKHSDEIVQRVVPYPNRISTVLLVVCSEPTAHAKPSVPFVVKLELL